jgi:Contractile injection system tube protein
MSASFSPRLLKGGIVLIKPDSGQVVRVIALQYNPDTLTRTLQPQGISGESNNRAEATRLKGPPIETIKLDAEIDATDQMEAGDPQTAQTGIQSQLAALETIVYPPSDQLNGNNALARSGTLELVPMQSFLTLFVWSKSRILPVRITDFSVTEEAFDPQLNPIRAKVSLSLRVLSVDDLGFDSKGGSLFMIYQQQKERLASQGAAGGLSALGIGGLP